MTDVAVLKYRLSEVFKSVHEILTKHADAEPLVGGTIGGIADLWTFNKPADQETNPYTSTDVCIMMTLLKMARIRNGVAVEDSFKDAIGYLALGLLNYYDEHRDEIPDPTYPEDELCHKE